MWDVVEASQQWRLQGNLFRLSCPLLVKAIDKWEAEGAVVAFNKKIAKSSSMVSELVKANNQNAQIRSLLLTPEILQPFVDDGGSRRVGAILESGIAGLSRANKGDIKCLHAQVADHLCREKEGGENSVGEMVMQGLNKRGEETEGNDLCKQQCDSKCSKASASWWYLPKKNKQKLWQSQRNRREGREPEQARQVACAPDLLR
jgi:hypothetical protein